MLGSQKPGAVPEEGKEQETEDPSGDTEVTGNEAKGIKQQEDGGVEPVTEPAPKKKFTIKRDDLMPDEANEAKS